MLNQSIEIKLDAKTSRYLIFSPPWRVDQMRSIPNRRWCKIRKAWVAPVIRANSRHLMEKMATANWSPEARDACERSLEVKIQKIEARFPQVYNFKTSPRPYQRTGLDKAWDSEAFGFYMDMGTGKSKMAVDLFCAYFAEGRIDRLLVVTKYSTRDNWIDEFKIHAPFECDVRILETSKAKKFDEWNTTPSDKMKVLIVATESMSAGNAPKYAQKFLSVTTRGGMVVDESHMIKTHNAIRSKNIVRIGLQAKFKVVMTGTPIAQSPLDLYMQFQFLDENIIGLGDYYSFRNRYAEMGGFEKKEIIGYQNMDELMELVAPYIFQVRKEDVLTELPPKVFEVRKCTMTPTQLGLYQQVKKKRRVVDGDKGNIIQTVLEQTLRLHEIAGGIITYQREPDEYNKDKFFKERIAGGSGKITELLDVTRENPVSTIVWCTYREEIAMVVEALQAEYGKDAVVQIHGGIESDQRQVIVRDVFQTKKARFLVSNQAVGGTGLNITAAELVIYYSNSFNYIDRVQSEDRAHRIGQTKSVLYVDLVVENTIDEVVVEALKSKQDVSEYVRGRIDEVKRQFLD